MNLFELYATISLNSKNFDDALKRSEGSLASLGKSIVSTQALIKGMEAAFGAVKKVVGDSVNEYARYEQLIGGVDTLFKGASQKVQQYAKEAYKTAGLSANDYMEQATSFSASLIQGLKGNTEKAADLANVAITDMADNANKMGTDISAIQNAYQGFAKSNFTMLDNLKLGYGGTKQEMVRLINDSGVLDKKIKSVDEVSFDKMIEAIHAIQKELGITGTTAEEAASTIEGSKASLLSAFQNLLTFTADGTDKEQIQKAQDAFVTSFATYFNDNLAPRIVQGLKGSDEVFLAIASAITTIPQGTLSDMVEGGIEGATGLVNGLTNIAGWLVGEITEVFKNPKNTVEGATNLGIAIGNFVGTSVVEALGSLDEVLPGLFTAGVNLAGGLIEGLIAGITGTGEGTVYGDMSDINEELNRALEEAFSNEIEAESIINYLDTLKEKYGDTAESTDEWASAIERLVELDDSYAAFFDSETGRLTTSTEALREHVKAMKEEAIQRAMLGALQDKQAVLAGLIAQNAYSQAAIDTNSEKQATALGRLNAFVGSIAGTNEAFNGAMTAEYQASLVEGILKNKGWDTSNMDKLTYLEIAAPIQAAFQDFISKTGYVQGEQMTPSQMSEFVRLLAEQTNASEKETAEVNASIQAHKEATEEIDKHKKAIDENNEAIKTVETEISYAQAAVEQLTVDLGIAAQSAEAFARSLGGGNGHNPNLNIYGEDGGYNGGVRFVKRATGLDRVPYDGFRAELHRDEAVLTRAEADAWRRGGTAVGFDAHALGQIVAGAIRDGMSSVGFYFDKERVAAAITDDVSRNVVNGMAAWGYA